MSTTLQVGRISGIPIYLHWTFLLFPCWVSAVVWWTGYGIVDTLWFVGFILSIFTSVTLHELGHAFSARRYGVSTKDITLSPFGGMARLNRLPDSPIHEFVVAAAGPMVNIIIALILGTIVVLFSTTGFDVVASPMREITPSTFLPALVAMNVVLVAFNLIPAFPMDGGRILRSLLSIKVGRMQATKIAAFVGQMIAIMFGIVGFLYSPILIFIGIFVFLTASGEYDMILMQNLLGEHSVKEVMSTDVSQVQVNDTMQDAANMLVDGESRHLLVMNGPMVEGILPNKTLVKALADKKTDEPVENFMKHRFAIVTPSDKLTDVFEMMDDEPYLLMPVYENGVLVGVVDLVNLNEFIQIQNTIANKK